MKEQMNIHKALAELKIIDVRIKKRIYETTFCLANKHSNKTITGQTIPTVSSEIKANYQSIDDLIRRRNAIKRAVVLSNAVTQVTIAGVNYTVAEAIEMNNSGIKNKEYLLTELKNQFAQVLRKIEDNSGETLEMKAQNYVVSVISAQPKDSKMAIDSEAMTKLRKEFIENNTYDLIDPLGCSKLIESLETEINNFKAEVDAALSVSNAVTVIDVEY